MSDALPLPPRPDIDHYRKLAKELRRACRTGENAAVFGTAAGLATAQASKSLLSELKNSA